MTEEIPIEVNGISKSFSFENRNLKNLFSYGKQNHRFLALDNISFTVPKGKIYGIIGLNGSGKTTLLRIIAGIYKPDSGKVTVRGNLAPILQTGTGFNDEIKAEENIITSGIILGMEKSEIKKKVDKIIEFAELEKFREQKLKYYSSGMKARLACSTALEINPDIILMDEILSTGDIHFREKSYKAFLSFKDKGKTILYTTHNIQMAKDLSEKLLLINKGKLVEFGEPKEVIAKYQEIANEKKK